MPARTMYTPAGTGAISWSNTFLAGSVSTLFESMMMASDCFTTLVSTPGKEESRVLFEN